MHIGYLLSLFWGASLRSVGDTPSLETELGRLEVGWGLGGTYLVMLEISSWPLACKAGAFAMVPHKD